MNSNPSLSNMGVVRRYAVRISAFFVFLVLTPILIFLGLELSLYVGHRSLGLNSLSPIAVSVKVNQRYRPYSSEKDCVKIAVFGGSNIAGFGIELTAPMILEHELSKLPGCYFVKNLASPGAYMTGYGDSVLRSLDEFYDHFLVYSGHNELLSLVDDDYQVNLIKDDFKSEKSYWIERAARLVRAHFDPSKSIELADNRFTSGLPYGLVSKSRVIALAARIARYPEDYLNRMKEVILQAIDSAEASEDWFPSVLEPDRVVEHISSIPFRYQDSLQELNREKTLLSTVSGNLFFPPNWSVTGEHNAHFFFDRGMSKYTGSDSIDWEAFENANSLDGFPLRVLSGVNDAIRTSGFQFIDFDLMLKSRIESGGRFSDYFSDMQHLNGVGHILLARAFLCGLGHRDYCSHLDYNALKRLEIEYLGVFYTRWFLDQEIDRNALRRLFWAYRMSAFSSCPLCYVRLTKRPAASLLGAHFEKYEAYIEALHDENQYSELTKDATYEFLNFLPRRPLARRATKAFFVSNLPKLNLCSDGEDIVGCPNRTTTSYQSWQW